MTRHFPRLLPALSLPALSLLVLSLPVPAAAQVKTIEPQVGSADRAEKHEKPPPALPGARAQQNVVAPSDRPTNDMLPNDALFDAINRGDLPVARDAISRGADLNATNVLGLTPLELAIDLGRNDISFLLLSLRGAGGSTASRPAALGAAPQQGSAAADVPASPTPAQRRAQLLADRRAQREAQREARAGAAADGTPAAPAAQAPPLFAGNGGTPNPSAGFVGFGR